MKKIPSALSILLLCLVAGPILADPGPGTQRDWPVWSGPEKNMTSLGNGVFDRESFGLEKAWSRPLGSAYSGIAVVGDHVVTGFSDGASDFLVSLDAASGEEQWRYRISDYYAGHDGSDDGPLATPMISDGTVYGLGAWGHLFALSLEDGKELWAHDVVKKFGARKPEYGFTTTPTVVGDLVVVETGGDDGRSISAFDRKTGELEWATGDDMVGYQSPQVLTLGGTEQILAVTNKHMMGLEPATGEVLWRHQHDEGNHDGFSQPVPVGKDEVLLTYWRESALFRVAKNGDGYGVEEVWRTNALRGNYAIPAPYKGHLYGFSGRFLTCVDAATGETVWKSRPPGGGNLVLVDGHLVIQAPSGEVVVAEATPDGYNEKARVAALERGYFTRPSFAGGRVYVRNLKDIAAVGVTERAAQPIQKAETDAEEVELKGEFGAKIRELMAAEDKKPLVDKLMAAHDKFPIIEGKYVHFVYRGDVADLAVAGNAFRGGGEQLMHRVEGTNLFFTTVELPPRSRYTYHFSVFDDQQTDPLNPHKLGPEGREESELRTAGWVAPTYYDEPTGERGRIEKMQWKSEILDNEREVQIYLPAAYEKGEERYPVLVVNHGDQALMLGSMDRALDNLIGSSVAPMIVAFVPRAAWPEFSGSATGEFSSALVKELLPTLDAKYRTVTDAGSRGIMGVGSAGFAAIFAAFKSPDVFGKAAAQSFYKGDLHDDLLAMVDAAKKQDLELLFHMSTYDYGNPGGDFDARRDATEMVAKLKAKGFEPSVLDVDDGAGWGMWRGKTGQILESFFPLK